MRQKTIGKEVILSGQGLHNGKSNTLVIKPGKPNTGYVFVRTDLENKPRIPALCDYVTDTSRGTTLSKDDVSVNTVEHLLAATYALGIDNVVFELDGCEVPILDGSSKYFIEAYHKAGIVEQDGELVIYNLDEKIRFYDEERDIEIVAYPDNNYNVKVLVDYNCDLLSNQFACLDNLKDFTSEIAACRTFVFLSELEPLLRLNLIKGGDLDNAIVIVDKETTQEEFDRLAKLFNKPSVKVQKSGVLNNLKLFFNNEPARHKLLDVIGDIALTGYRFNASIIAHHPGHFGNTEMAKLIRNYINLQKDKRKKDNIPIYDPNQKPLMDINQLKKYLPHRFPFLFVDKIYKLTDTEVIGIKAVANDEYYFQGHFPDEPVMPGVLQLEAMAQTGGILALSTIPDPENYLTFFMKIDKVKFRKKVFPGDVMVMRLVLIEPIRRGIVHMKGETYVGNTLVSEAEMFAQIVKSKE